MLTHSLIVSIAYSLTHSLTHSLSLGGIGSFVLCMMIVSFLQMRQQELSLASHNHSPHAWNLGSLLIDFFDLYGGSFNLIHTGISTSGNGAYFNKQARGSTDWFNTARPTLLAIENPDLTEVNMGNNSYMISKIRKCFEHMRLVCGSIMRRNNSKSYLAHVIRPDDLVLVSRAKKLKLLSSSSFVTPISEPPSKPMVHTTQPAAVRPAVSHDSPAAVRPAVVRSSSSQPVQKNTIPNQNHKARRKEERARQKQAKRLVEESSE